MKNSKVLESFSSIRFPDCDPFNHLNNSRYLDYFINAREDHLIEAYDFNIFEYAKETGTTWLISKNQIAYFSPALLLEKVLIQSTILEWNKDNIRVEMQMWNEKKTRVKALLWTDFTHYDLKHHRKIVHNLFLTEAFKNRENPLSKKISFEERVVEIKRVKH